MEDRERMKRAAALFCDHADLRPRLPDEDTLRSVFEAFSRIPWENLTKFLVKAEGVPVRERLRLADTVISEHLELGTGGTCFSLTEALGSILAVLGFRCAPVMADMNHGRNIHCALSVITREGRRFLADPGYLVPEPVRLEPDVGAVARLHGERLTWEPVRDDIYDLHSSGPDGPKWRYRVRMTTVDRDEFIGHWQNSFDAAGMNSLHANLREGTARLSAHNLNLRRVDLQGSANEKLRDDYPLKMEESFGISRRVAMEAEREWRASCRARQNRSR